ncbi:OLC1v1024108C1 [Oldenlandia corymbosa var. corymbosa]|uniref:OLC1v1024108C1 n=1 Tax=Oldenlandia corymbosa var. corymbosa TaxID=529605 RepID=A0AAV1C1Y4_OLDCO|nr:OLC1v1024108C1 [Oldenlandia corymbosa var. corymbosa]
MSRQRVMINQVKPQVGGRRSRWTALIQVVERSKIQQIRSGKTNEIRRYVFTDEEGTKVGAAIFDNDICYFDDFLIPFVTAKSQSMAMLVEILNAYHATEMLSWRPDSTGTITTYVLATEAEKLIRVKSEALRTAEDQDVDLSTTIQNALKQHNIVAFFRKYDSTFQGRASEKYSIVKSYLIQDLLMNETPQRKALPFEEIT